MTVNLKDLGNFDFQSHPHTKNILILQIFFDNGYGVSIITNTKNSKKTHSHNTVSYDVAILKGAKNDNELIVVPDMKYVDPDYDNYNSNEGVWKDLEFDKLYHKAKIISLL